MRKAPEIIEELKSLIKQRGYIYSLCMILVEDFHFNPEKLHEIDYMEKISIQEATLLLGFLIQNEIDFSIPDTATDLINMKKKTYELMKELHLSFNITFIDKLKEEMKEKDIEEYKLDRKEFFGSGSMLIEPMFYSGSGVYDFQYLEFLEKKYKYDIDWLLTNFGFDIFNTKIIVKKIKEILQQKAQKLQVISLKGILPEMKKEFLKKNSEKDLENNIDEIIPVMELYQYLELFIDPINGNHGIDEFYKNLIEMFVIKKSDIDDDNIDKFLNNFSIEIGKGINSEFQKIGDYNLINSHPILKLDEDRYFIPISFLIFQTVYESPFYWMIKDVDYNVHAANNRGKVGEEITYEYLVKVFGIENTFKSVKIVSDNGDEITDIDVLCILGSKVLCVQVKSKSLTLLSRQGNDEQIQKDFQGAIQNAINQGLISSKELLDRKSKLLDEKGNEISLSEDIDEIYIMCVTTENYPALPHQSHILLTKNEENPYPICLSVFDLELLTHYLNDPFDFLYYIRQRISLMEYFYADEEMSFLGFHLDQKLWKKPGTKLEAIDPSFAKLIDRNYYPLKAGIDVSDEGDAIKNGWQNEEFDKLCQELKKIGKSKITDILFYLFDLSGKARETLVDYIKKIKQKTLIDNKNHDFSLPPNEDDPNRFGITYMTSTSDTYDLESRLFTFCTLRKYKSKSDCWIGFGAIRKSTNMIDAVFFDTEPWKYNKDLEKDTKLLFEGKGQLIKTNKIGRNEKCSCGSGLKFKKCCGRNKKIIE